MPLGDSRPARLIRAAIARVVRLIGEIVRRYVDVGAIERGVAVGSQAFTALLPMLMLYAVVIPRREGRSVVDTLAHRFHLSGSEADTLRAAFQPTGVMADSRSSTSAISVVLLLVAALSFTRTMQRLYERCYGLDRLGFKGTPYGLLWLLLLALPAAGRSFIGDSLSGTWLAVAVLALNTVTWFFTPVLLASRRLTFRRVVPTSIITAIAMTVLGAASAFWLPHSVATSAGEFGMIGVAFALISWLVGAGITVSIAAVVGSAISDEFDPRETGRTTRLLDAEPDPSARGATTPAPQPDPDPEPAA